MNSVFATAKGSQVSISPEALAIARNTLSQAPNFNDEVLSQSPLKTASGSVVPVDPEALKVIKRKFADYDDDACQQSPAKRQADDDEPDYSSLFRRAGSGKAIKISESALSAAKRAMGGDENDSTENGGAEPSTSSFTSPMLAATLTPFPAVAAAAAAASTTPLRSTPLQARRRPQLQQPGGGGGNQFKSPFNSPFRPPIVAPPAAAGGFASPLAARPAAAAAAAAATPATVAASPLSRLCLNSPASSSNSGVTITPIADLTSNSRGFTIRVKVTERTGSIVGYGSKGEGRFCCWLSDASELQQQPAADAATTPAARLEAEAGGAAATRAAAELQYGKVYDIRHPGRLSIRRPADDNPRGIVLFFDEKTKVTEVPSSSTSSTSTTTRPRHRSSLLPLSDVWKEGEIDLAGIVGSIKVSGPSPMRGGGEMGMGMGGRGAPCLSDTPSIEVKLLDQRASLVLTLPQEYSRVELKPGDLLLVYRASVKRVNGAVGLKVSAVRGRTKLLLNPESEDGRVVALGRWARGGAWAATGATTMRSIAAIEDKIRSGQAEARGGVPCEFLTKAMVANVDAAAQPTMEVCATCGGTITKDTTMCNCAGVRGMRRRLLLDVDMSDGTGLLRATAVGSVAEELVGMDTSEAEGMLRWNRDEWRFQCRQLFYGHRVFKMRRDESTTTGLRILEILPVPYPAYHPLICKKLDKKRAEK